jgi:hypothetical protein
VLARKQNIEVILDLVIIAVQFAPIRLRGYKDNQNATIQQKKYTARYKLKWVDRLSEPQLGHKFACLTKYIYIL